MQPENGLPISSWYDDPNDMELEKLYRLLIMLSKVKDVRPYIKKIVANDQVDYSQVVRIFKSRKEYSHNCKILKSLIGEESKRSNEKTDQEYKTQRDDKSKSRRRNQNENIDSTNSKRVEEEYEICFSNKCQAKCKDRNKDSKTNYHSPNKSSKGSKFKTTITLEENYSQTK